MILVKYIFVVIALVISLNAQADVEVVNTDEQGKKSIVKLNSQWGKVIDTSEPDQYMLINMISNTVYIVDSTEKMVVKLENLQGMRPANPHENMKQAQPDIQIIKSGKGPKVAGYETTIYELFADGKRCSTHYISKAPLKQPEIKAFSDNMQKQAESVPDMGFDNSICEIAETYFDKKSFDYGIPLLSKNAEGAEVFKITRIDTEKKFSKEEFELPPGYPVLTQRELMQREMQNMSIPTNDPTEMPSPEAIQQQLQQLQEMMKQQNN